MKKYVPYIFKHLIKKYTWFIFYYNKIYGAGKIANKIFLQNIVSNFKVSDPLNVFSTDNEDGILLQLIQATGVKKRNFVDIGAHDGLNSNCANLTFHHKWKGIFIDADKKALLRGKYIYNQYFGITSNQFFFVNTIILPQNINQVISELVPDKDLDLLCMDLDGNDYYIWKALEIIRPAIVVVEAQAEKKGDLFIEEYKNDIEVYEENVPKGASVRSMQLLGMDKGYKLVALNKHCYNLFFVRNDLALNMPAIQVDDICWSD